MELSKEFDKHFNHFRFVWFIYLHFCIIVDFKRGDIYSWIYYILCGIYVSPTPHWAYNISNWFRK